MIRFWTEYDEWWYKTYSLKKNVGYNLEYFFSFSFAKKWKIYIPKGTT